MTPSSNPKFAIRAILAIALVLAIFYAYTQRVKTRVAAQAPQTNSASVASTNATESPATNAAPNVLTNEPSSTNAAPAGPTVIATPPPNMPPRGGPPGSNAPASEEPDDGMVQLSFQGANVDMIVQWLAKTTGKSVIKHPRVQCQLTIVSSSRLPEREALNLVYRALALEGFSVLESSKSILVVPEGQEPKLAPEMVNGADVEIPEGRQRLLRIFNLEHTSPGELSEKIRTVLSEKATVEVVDRANQLIITDYTENMRLVSELIKELDVSSPSDVTIEFFKLEHAQADEISGLLTQILNARPPSAAVSTSSRPSSPPPGRPTPPGMPTPSPSPSPSPSPGPSGGSGGGGSEVKIWVDKASNQLIVAAPKSRMEEIEALLEVLDTEKTKDVTIRVIPLQNVSAEDLVKEIGPLYQRMGSQSAQERIEITANGRSNSLIILSSEVNFRAIQRLVEALDKEDAQEKVLRAFRLTNADAEDVAKQLQELQTDQSTQNRYPYYIFSSSMGRTDSKKISVVADRRRNAVLVQGPPAGMEQIEQLIEELDAPISDNSLQPRIFRLQYISAVDLEEVLNELFLKNEQQVRSYWDYYSTYNSRDTGTGGKLYGKVRITSEPYSNSLIVTANSPESLDAVEAVIRDLDRPSQAGETTMRLTLNFAKATTIASSLNILFAKQGSPPLRQNNQQPQQQQPTPFNQQAQLGTQRAFELEEETQEDTYYPWLGGQQEGGGGFGRFGDTSTTQRPVSDLIGKVRVVPDRRSNSLMITSNLHFFPQILKLINELDAPTPQVLIEAKIIEVSSDFRDKLGVRWSPDPNSFSGEDLDNSALINSSALYQEVFAGSPLPGALKTGIIESSVNINFLIQFLRKNTDARVLAEPQINISDNELGRLFVGSQVPFISGSLNTDTGGRNDTFQYKDVGVILEVTPHINHDDAIALKIRTESSNLREGVTLFGGAILDTRNFRTDLMVKDGETVVLGGIIQRDESEIVRKVPGLGSIPGLGWAFKKKDKILREVELMVFLTPRVTRSPAEARELLLDVRNKAPLIKSWDEGQPALTPEELEKAREHLEEMH